MELDLTVPLGQAVLNGFAWEDQVRYVMVLDVVGMAFDSWTGCQAVGGF